VMSQPVTRPSPYAIVTQMAFSESSRNGFKTWFLERLPALDDVDGAVCNALDLIGGFERDRLYAWEPDDDRIPMILHPGQKELCFYCC
jgi:hypothetical protein